MLASSSCSCINDDLRPELPYTEAVLEEVQRLGNIVPGAILHSNKKSVMIGGYVLPPGTAINSNMDSFLMDPEAFPEPEKFNPDRYLDDNGCFVAHPNIIPFGIGKRRCLGESLAKTELFIFFAGLMQKFEVRLANEDDVLSTSYRPGITLTPYPYEVRFVARN